MPSQQTDHSDLLPQNREDRINWAYRVAERTQKAQARFDAWADNYDQDVEDLLGWSGPQATLKFAVKHLSKDDLILDAGAGTGLMGKLLASEGFKHLVATDISPKMLEVARKKGVYEERFVADLTKPLPIDEPLYDCVLAVGVSGYMTARTLQGFAQILKSHGFIIYTISDKHFAEHGFREVVEGLVAEGAMEVSEVSEPFAAIPKSEPSHLARVHVYKKIT